MGEMMQATPLYVIPPASAMRTDLTREECALVVYLETCLVDHGGQVRSVHMNEADFAIAKRWTEEGFIKFSRMMAEIRDRDGDACCTHRVQFSPEAFATAAWIRRARAERHVETVLSPNVYEYVDGHEVAFPILTNDCGRRPRSVGEGLAVKPRSKSGSDPKRIARLKRRLVRLRERLAAGFPETWYAGEHWTSEIQERECRCRLSEIERELQSLSAAGNCRETPTVRPRR